MNVTDTSNGNDDIVMTVYSRKNAARVRDGAEGKAQDNAGVRNINISLSSSSLSDSAILFHETKKVRSKEKSFRKKGSGCRHLRRR